MKTIKKILVINSLVIISFGILTLSCTKSVNKPGTGNSDSLNNKSSVASDDKNILKTGEDVLNADYRQFYDDLSPYGKWIKVTPKDIGLKPKKETEKKNEKHSSILDYIPGIINAYADVDVSWDFFFVWQPSPSLSVGIVAGEPQPAYVPYVHGRWIYTDRGWYFRAPTYCEEVVHHYGRWCYNDDYGWIWLPGRVWAPSWVSWEEDDNYVGWAPCETSVYINDSYYVIPSDRYAYVTTEKKYFLDPEVYRYARVNRFDNDNGAFRDMRRFNGLTERDRMITNNGPDTRHFEKFYGRDELRPVKINTVNDVRNVSYGKNEYKVYAPEYKSKSDNRSSGNNFRNNEQTGKDNNNKRTETRNDNRIDKNKIYSDKIEKVNKNRESSVTSENRKNNISNRNPKTDNGTSKNKDYSKNNNRDKSYNKNRQNNSGRDKSYGLKKSDKQGNNNYNRNNNNQKKQDRQNNNNYNRNSQKQNRNQQQYKENRNNKPPERNYKNSKGNNNNRSNNGNNNQNRNNNNNNNNNKSNNNNREHKK